MKLSTASSRFPSHCLGWGIGSAAGVNILPQTKLASVQRGGQIVQQIASRELVGGDLAAVEDNTRTLQELAVQKEFF
jgi:hypothetical protein